MLKCPKCGSAIKDGQKFCTKCGTKIERVSPEISAKIDILIKRIEKDSLNAELYIQLGEIYYQNGRLKEALFEYQKAVNIDDTNYAANLKSGNAYLKLKEIEKAETSYKRALTLNSESQEAIIGLFWTYYAQNRIEDVFKVGEEIDTKLKNLDIHKALKNMYLKKEIKDKAFTEMKAISTFTPDDKDNLKEMAKYYQEKNEDEKVFECYQKVLELDSEDIDARFAMGEYFYTKGDYQKTIDYLEDIIEELSPQIESYARTYLADVYIDQQEWDKAINEINLIVLPLYEDLTSQHKKLFAKVYFKIGNEILDKGDFSSAINYLDKATNYEPQNMEYKKQLNEIREKQRIVKIKVNRKTRIIAISIISVIVLAAAGWYLSHGMILVQVFPIGIASIYVDDEGVERDLGNGGFLSANLFFGTHKVTIKKGGYEDWEQKVKVGYGKTTIINAELLPIYGGFKISSNPSGAEVYVDDIILPLGKTPFTTNEILSINHRLELKLEGYKNFTDSININKKEIYDLGKITLNNLYGKWRGGAPRAEREPFDVRINQKECSIEINFTRRSGSDKVNGKLVRPYGVYWGNLRGEVRGQKIFAKGYVTGRYYDAFWTIDKEKKNIAMEGSISRDWNRIEGIITGGFKAEFWINREE